jgi:hypothetical protein
LDKRPLSLLRPAIGVSVLKLTRLPTNAGQGCQSLLQGLDLDLELVIFLLGSLVIVISGQGLPPIVIALDLKRTA